MNYSFTNFIQLCFTHQSVSVLRVGVVIIDLWLSRTGDKDCDKMVERKGEESSQGKTMPYLLETFNNTFNPQTAVTLELW